MRANATALARVLLSLVDFGNHGFGLQCGRRETARRLENGPGLKHFGKSATVFSGKNPIPQLNGMDIDADFGCFRLHMGQKQRADFEPLVEQLFVTEIAQHMMQRAKRGMVKLVRPMPRLMRGFGRVDDLIADVRADFEACFIG
jgi:hypothetical protein